MFILKSLGFTVENGQPNNITNVTNLTSLIVGNLSTEDSVSITTEDDFILIVESEIGPTYAYQLASEAIDLSIARDGGESFGNSFRIPMNAIGKRTSRLIWQQLGQANDMTPQLRFSGFGRFVAFDGIMEIYQ